MSFRDDLTLQLRADLAQALGLPAAAVYCGREPQKVTRAGIEVWLRPLPVDPQGAVKVHPVEVHVRLKGRREQDHTGAAQLDQVHDLLDRLRARYDATRPFVGALPTLVAVQADVGALDADPDDDDLLDGALTLKVLER